jgi:hypothetical protein
VIASVNYANMHSNMLDVIKVALLSWLKFSLGTLPSILYHGDGYNICGLP